MQAAKISECIAPSFYNLHNELKKNIYGEVWLKGGRGSTKSSFVSVEIILGLLKYENSNAIIVRRYDNELRDTVYGQYKWAAHKLGVDHLFNFMLSPMKAVYIPTGQTILFKGADNPLKLKSINLGKGYIKYLHVEETDQFSGFEELRNIMQSIFRGEGNERIALFSYNPPKSARSWVNQESKIPKPGRIVHHSDYKTVPHEWLGDRFHADAEHLQKVNETAYRHEYLGEEVGTGLEIFNNVESRPITQEEIDSFNQIEQGLDFGYAVDPLSFVRLYYNTKKRWLYIFDERSGIGISNRQLYEMLPDHWRRQQTIADNAEPKSIDELRSYGMNVIKCNKGPGSVEQGVKWLADLEKIIVDPVRCPRSSKEFVNYALEINRNGDIISKYPDKDNHCIDATRYGLQRYVQSRQNTLEPSGISAGALGL